MTQHQFLCILNLLEFDIKEELTQFLQVKDWQFVSGECFMCT